MRGRRATADSRHLAFVSATWVVSAAFWPTRRVARDMSANVGDIVNDYYYYIESNRYRDLVAAVA